MQKYLSRLVQAINRAIPSQRKVKLEDDDSKDWEYLQKFVERVMPTREVIQDYSIEKLRAHIEEEYRTNFLEKIFEYESRINNFEPLLKSLTSCDIRGNFAILVILHKKSTPYLKETFEALCENFSTEFSQEIDALFSRKKTREQILKIFLSLVLLLLNLRCCF